MSCSWLTTSMTAGQTLKPPITRSNCGAAAAQLASTAAMSRSRKPGDLGRGHVVGGRPGQPAAHGILRDRGQVGDHIADRPGRAGRYPGPAAQCHPARRPAR